MQAELAVNRQLQKTFKTAQQVLVKWKETSEAVNSEIIVTSNLFEQLHCCDKTCIDNTSLHEFCDLKEKLRSKLISLIEDSLDRAKLSLENIQDHVAKVSRQYEQCMQTSRKYSQEITLSKMVERTELWPSIVDMLEWLQSIETTFRQQLASQVYILSSLEYDKPEKVEKFLKYWKQGNDVDVVQKYLFQVTYFMQEKF